MGFTGRSVHVLRLIIATVCVLCVLSPMNLCQSSTPVDSSETRGQKLLQQAIEALGGQAYLTVKDMTLIGRFYQIFHGSTSGAAPFVDYIRYPDKERQELGKKKESIVIFNGDKGWDVDFRGAHPWVGEQVDEYLRNQKYSLDRILRFDLKTNKYRVYFDGTEYIQALTYDVVTLEDSNRERMSILLDSQTHLPEAVRYRFRAAGSSGVDHMETWVSNYQSIGGVMTPLKRERIRNGEPISQTFVTEVKYNTGLPDSMFRPK